MSGSLIRHLLRRSLELPPQLVVRKAAGLLRRTAVRWLRDRRDALRSSYTRRGGTALQLAVSVSCEHLGAGERAALRDACEEYLAHRFDLLGSGWCDAGYGAPAPGIEGVCFPPTPEALAIARSGDPAGAVTRPNRAAARACLALIDDPDYRCIDWQRDARSGFRWSARTPIAALAIGRHRGADIKLPWELSRLQHLPQLALAAMLARDGARGFQAPARYLAEIRNQCLDFIGSNPPRHGACWGCPMDVGIRAANLVLARAMVIGAGFELDRAFEHALAASVAEHGAHIVAHVEWSEHGRSNHFLADLAGLMFCAAALPPSEETGQWLAYASSWLLNDILVQFHADGGCYEGSTGYHRLSAELVVYAAALVHRTVAAQPEFLARLAREPAPAIRGGLAPLLAVPTDRATSPFMNPLLNPLAGLPTATDTGPGTDPDRGPDTERDRARVTDAVLDAVGERLRRMHGFLRAVRRPDGNLVLIGDMDSGRLFRFVPRAEASAAGQPPLCENHRDPSEALDALAGLCALEPAAEAGIAGALVRALAGDVPWDRGVAVPDTREGDAGTGQPLAALLEEARALAVTARRERAVEVPGLDPGSLVCEQFPQFGLLVVRGEDFHLTLRCADNGRDDAPTSHLHDDNLALSLLAGGAALVSDPGTYVYTPFPELRNAYRRREAHFVPRAREWDAVAYTEYLFELRLQSRARCLHRSRAGLAVRLEAAAGYVQRVVLLQPGMLHIIDTCSPGALADDGPPIDCCTGYGIRTTRPSVAL